MKFVTGALLQCLQRPSGVRNVIAIATLLALPSAFAPLVADDFAHALKWQAWRAHGSLAELPQLLNDFFAFVKGPGDAAREIERWTWWTAPDLKIAFWRPLAAATHAMDHWLWPASAPWMHLHSLLWFVALLLALHVLYRRLASPLSSVLALALYAWDDQRGMVLAWVANRNALIAGCFGVSALVAHDRWRRSGWRMGAWLGPLLLASALLSAEMAIATVGYLLAYTLYLDREPGWKRWLRLLPYLLVVALWQTSYLVGGYGVEATGFYAHPLKQPLEFAVRVLEHAPVLALASLTPFPADTWFLLPVGGKLAIFAASLAVLFVFLRVIRRELAGSAESRFWMLGAALSLLPICATFPSDRNLVFVGFGAAPVMAAVIWRSLQPPLGSLATRLAVGALVLFHFVLAPLMLPAKSVMTLALQHMMRQADESVPKDESVTGRVLTVVWTSSEAPLGFSWAQRSAEGAPLPGKTRLLALSNAPVTVRRVDARTLRIHSAAGWFDSAMHQLSRGPSRPFHAGDSVRLSDVTVLVAETTRDGRPATVEFRWATPLESPERLWMRGDELRLVSWVPPAVGDEVVLP